MAENVSFAEPKKTFKLRKGPVKKSSTASPSLNTSLPVASTFSNTSTPPIQQSNKRRNPFSTVDNVNDDKRQRLSDNNVHFNSPGELFKHRFVSGTASPLTGSKSIGAVQNNFASQQYQGWWCNFISFILE